MLRELQRFWEDESGQDFIEYVAVSLIVLIAVVLLIRQFAGELANAFDRLREWVVAIYTGGELPQ
jgi:Flp pilus assembly pilin Flp